MNNLRTNLNENKTQFFLQCLEKRAISYCHECRLYPCTKFSKRREAIKNQWGIDIKLLEKRKEIFGNNIK